MPIPALAKPDYFTNAHSSGISLPMEELRPLIRAIILLLSSI